MQRLLLPALLLLVSLGCHRAKPTLFQRLDPQQTGVAFNNDITENDTLTILYDEFIYNGGGVGIGDLNGDGLQDLYFTGNQVDNKLYLNRGQMRFEDVTDRAQAQKRPGQWSAGVNMVDLNRDGRLDIYVCNTFILQPELRKNLLFVNQGNDAQGIPQFSEIAEPYGIADSTHSANAQFFDCDNDGDLDLFIGVNVMDREAPNRYIPKTPGISLNRDRLYRNDWDTQKGHPVFTDVSIAAGIKWDGYSHSSLVFDFDGDGRQDIYVANDYVTNDLVYLNRPDSARSGAPTGFVNRAGAVFKHQAASAMGSDVADVNNDGLLDVFTTEMLPYENKRKKLFLSPNNYATYLNNDLYGYEHQYARNVLQLNRGPHPVTGLPQFSDIAFMAGVQETEWSWTPLLADLDNDGWRDLFITNGFPRDVTDHDFGNYRSTVNNLMTPMDMQSEIPQVKVPKFAFRNGGDLRFSDVSADWGVDVPAFSNGAACGDLDNDGDLDLVVNNIDDPAFIFENTTAQQPEKGHFLRVKVTGEAANPDAFGTEVIAYFNGQAQIAGLLSGRGYLSCSENVAHFGLGSTAKVDSVVVRWRGQQAAIPTPPIDQTLNIRLADLRPYPVPTSHPTPLLRAIDPFASGLAYMNRDTDFVDFNYQVTLPHKFSQYGPGLTVGDANGDGLDDLYLSGSALMDGTWFWQNADGTFRRESVIYKTDPEKKEEELEPLLFDADRDGDLDLYLTRGGFQYSANWALYQDALYVNDGKGRFSLAPNALPAETTCGQAVDAADFDGDGDLDLVVGGRVLPRSYPMPDRSFVLRNDTKTPNQPVFTDVTAQVCPELAEIGLVCDVLWTDFNQDKRPDLLLAGEWMPLTFLENTGGAFRNITPKTGIGGQKGWWRSLATADFDQDGDTDYVAGNLGENTYFKGSEKEPLSIYAADFDKNGYFDALISCFWRDSTGKRHEYFYHTRDDLIKQLIMIRRRFNTYGALGAAKVSDVFTKEELAGAKKMQANWFASSYVENLGRGKFKLHPLPAPAQLAPLFGMLPADVDGDGLTDLLLSGNDYGMELLQGRADAFYGLVLKNTGKGVFTPVELSQSGFFVPGDARGIAQVSVKGRPYFVATQNRGPLKVFTPAR